ncbi:MAG: hypothetical protein JNK37_00065 [Verrucomicrobiales bacterium]|nr:hypothetical protein [Verrucomicrobiales bacterium]
MKRPLATLLALSLLTVPVLLPAAEFQAGAALIDVTPEKLPVLVNGSMLGGKADKVKTRVHARAIAVSDGDTTVAIVVVDSCMMPRDLLDEAKKIASEKTGIPISHMLMSATHTHSAPSCMGALGTRADENYVPFLKAKLVEAVQAAVANLEPARVGFAKADAADYTAVRQWIRRPDRVVEDPFGNLTVRANMHAGRVWDDAISESGPEDPDVSLVSLQSRDGRPIAVLANFSMHYFGDQALSSDYFGLFSEGLKARIAPGGGGDGAAAGAGAGGSRPFVGIMSHGCSGDIWRRDYTRPESEWNAKQTIEDYTAGLLDIAMKAYQAIDYRADADVAMAESRMQLKYRVPDQQRLEWAQRVVAAMGDRTDPKDTTEVYAMEQIILHERQSTEIVVQGLRIGDIGIATTPNETYAITGLKIKAASPIRHNLVIELANGGDGYIPPPQMHRWGGYNTWPARSAGLEVDAEPKIAAAAIGLLEKVAAQPRRDASLSHGPAARAILQARPAAWWRLDEFAGPLAEDASGHHRDALYETDVAYYLEGPRSDYFCENGEKNRAPLFVGGRLQGRVAGLGDAYSVSLWIWNGMPADGRPVSGWFYSRGHDHGLGRLGDHLGIGGSAGHPGRLLFFTGDDPATAVAGKTEVPRWTWRHVVLVRDGATVRVYLDGRLEIETTAAGSALPATVDRFFFAGRSDNAANWEGRLDEIAVFDRALSPAEITALGIP